MANNTHIDQLGVIHTNNETIDFNKTIYVGYNKIFDMQDNLLLDLNDMANIDDYSDKNDVDNIIDNYINQYKTIDPDFNIPDTIDTLTVAAGTIINYSSDNIYTITSDILKIKYGNDGQTFIIDASEITEDCIGNISIVSIGNNKIYSSVVTKSININYSHDIEDQSFIINSSNMDTSFSSITNKKVLNGSLDNDKIVNMLDLTKTNTASVINIDSTVGKVNVGDKIKIGDEISTVGTIHKSDTVTRLSKYNKFACGISCLYKIDENGDLWSVGLNLSGMLGLGNTDEVHSFTKCETIDNVISIHTKGANAFALKSNGEVWGVGDNTYGQLGTGDTTDSSVWVRTGDMIADTISVGLQYVLALKSNGDVWGIGYNWGQLGDGNLVEVVSSWVKSSISNVKFIAAGYKHSMVINDIGDVYGTGRNTSGEIGNGVTLDGTNEWGYHTWQKSSISGANYISCGDDFTHVTTGTLNDVYSVGNNSVGQLGVANLGSGTYNTWQYGNVRASIIVSGLQQSALIHYSGAYNGRLMITGGNQDGQLGDGTGINKLIWVEPYTTPVFPSYIGASNSSITMIQTDIDDYNIYSSGTYIDTTGVIYNNLNLLNTGFKYDRKNNDFKLDSYYFEPTVNLTNTDNLNSAYKVNLCVSNDVIQDSGENNWNSIKNIYALIKDDVYVDNINTTIDKIYFNTNMKHAEIGDTYVTDYGQMFNVSDIVYSDPVKYNYEGAFTKICSGLRHTLALDQHNNVWVIGDNEYGQLGTSDTLNKNMWHKLTGFKCKDIACGDISSMILDTNGNLYVAGSNTNNILSFSDDSLNIDTWTKTNISNVKSIHAFSFSAVALTNDNKLFAVGLNTSGHLSVGDPSIDLNLENWVECDLPSDIGIIDKVSLSYSVMCVLCTDGATYTVGYNLYGNLGLGTTTDVSILTRTTLSNNIIDIDASDVHTAAVLSTGELVTIGCNVNYQLGDGTNNNSTSWITAISSDVKNVICKNTYTLATVVPANTTSNNLMLIGSYDEYIANNNTKDDTFSSWTLINNGYSNLKSVYSSGDSLFLLTEYNNIYAIGNNTFNKLGTNNVGSHVVTSYEYVLCNRYPSTGYIVPDVTLNTVPLTITNINDFILNTDNLQISRIIQLDKYKIVMFNDIVYDELNTIDKLTLFINLNKTNSLIKFNADLVTTIH